MLRKNLLLVLLLALSAAPIMSQRVRRAASSSSSISESALRAHIKFLSDDRLEGRGTGARGGETAALYIAAQFEALGLKGAGEKGSFWQPVSLAGVKADPKTELRINGSSGTETFKFADDFVAFTGAQTENVNVNAELVFVGYGIEAPQQKWNDYKGPADDYRGKILVMLVNDPPATKEEPDLFGGRRLTYYGRWTYKFEEAARRGAIGAILLHTNESAGYPWSVVRTSNGSWRFDLARTRGDQTPYLQVRSWITDEAAHRLMRLAGLNLDDLRRQAATRDFRPVKLNLTASINLNSEVKRVEAPNVVAILPGRDPKLRDEYVVYSAHWDHLGIGAPDKTGDTIYNGALDNATGVASVLEIARVLRNLPPADRPRRSILFLMTTGEEQNLLGAEWFSRHPLVPIESVVADINLDSMNILGPTRDFVPLGAERSSFMKAVCEDIARERGLRISPDPRPEQGSFFRSDHFPFAKVGVPSISLKEGSDYVGHPQDWGQQKFKEYNDAHYHQPSDEFRDDWNFEAMIQEADFAMELGRRVADAVNRPKFNPGDEFARRK
ncbi:MAG TPA: M28 family peptidase [Pyrinomonadaceae bacterium]|nr:M28 family peptidase [Pyrinomonadaceae bacterium]